ERTLEHRAELELLRLQIGPARQMEEVVHERAHPVHFLVDHAEELRLLLGTGFAPLESRRGSLEHRQGISDLVRHAGGYLSDRRENVRMPEIVLDAREVSDRAHEAEADQ